MTNLFNMAFKSFAKQGSFDAFQVPDTSKKILEQGERQIRGMQEAQAFFEKNQQVNQSLYRQANQIDANVREANYNLETKAEDLQRNVLDAQYRATQAADARRAAQKEKSLKELAALSKTAAEAVVSIGQQIDKADIARKNTIALQAGLTTNDLNTIISIDKNLTRSQFNQLDFIQNKLAEGGAPEQIDALFKVYKSSGTKTWFDLKNVQINTMNLYGAYLQEGIDALPDNATPEQIQAKISGLAASFLSDNFGGMRTEVLEKNGVFSAIRETNNSLYNTYYKKSYENTKNEVKLEYLKSLNGLFGTNKNVGAIAEEFTKNPSREKRTQIFEWFINGSKGDGPFAPTAAEIDSFLEHEYIHNGKKTTIEQQFPGEDLAKLYAARDAWTANARQKHQQGEADYEEALENELANAFNQAAEDGKFPVAEYDALVGIATAKGTPGFVERSRVLREAKTLTDDVRASKALSDKWQTRLDQGFPPPTLQEINDSYMTPADKSAWIQKRGAYSSYNDAFKEQDKLIDFALKNDERYPVTAGNKYNFELKSQELKRLLRSRVAARANGYEYISDIGATIVAELNKDFSNPGIFDDQGRFKSIVEREAAIVKEDKTAGKDFLYLIKSLKEVPETRREFKELISHYGAANYYADLDKIKAGQRASSKFYYVADALNMLPMELAEVFAKAGGQTFNVVKPELPPLTRRMYVHNPSEERQARGEAMSGLRSLPVRGAFGPTDASAIKTGDAGVKYLMTNFNIPKIGAAYLAGNIQQESGWNGMRSWGGVLNPSTGSMDGSNYNAGLISWAAFPDDRSRVGRIEGYLGKPIPQANHAEQLGAMLWEMQNYYPNAYRVFMNPKSTPAELIQASRQYWGYGHEGARYRYADHYLKTNY